LLFDPLFRVALLVEDPSKPESLEKEDFQPLAHFPEVVWKKPQLAENASGFPNGKISLSLSGAATKDML